MGVIPVFELDSNGVSKSYVSDHVCKAGLTPRSHHGNTHISFTSSSHR